jgi:hypothetical protein
MKIPIERLHPEAAAILEAEAQANFRSISRDDPEIDLTIEEERRRVLSRYISTIQVDAKDEFRHLAVPKEWSKILIRTYVHLRSKRLWTVGQSKNFVREELARLRALDATYFPPK